MTIPDCQDWFEPMLTHKLRNVLIVPQAGIRLLILLYLPKYSDRPAKTSNIDPDQMWHLTRFYTVCHSSSTFDGLGGSVGCAVRLETRRSRVQPPPRSATFFRGD